MKKIPLLFTALSAGISSLSMSYDYSSGILGEADTHFEEQERARGPALSAPSDDSGPYWESFNQWQCFPSENVEVSCAQAEYGQVVDVPILGLVYDSHYYEFSLDPDPKPDCRKVTEFWTKLLDGEDAFCAFGAFLQNYDGDLSRSGAKSGSVWIINRLKTRNGIWSFEASENWVKEDEPNSSGDETQAPERLSETNY